MNIYIVYRLNPSITSDITLENCLFGAVKLTKILKISTYSGYGAAFASKESFSHPSRGCGKNVIIFGADLSSSVHANNRAKNMLVLGKDFIQGINGTVFAEIFSISVQYLSMVKKLLILKPKILKLCHIRCV